ncbi:MAG TPA: hypothetical protein VJY54_05445 [Lachnospiraceae bacterium]|nr:hypothetical protein [Lachnospiraceae bacterium]
MTKNTNIRFYEEEEEDKRAWEILHSLDKKQFKSQSKFVVLAILDYYEKCLRQEQDPYFETREKEDAFSDRIVKSVEEKVISNLPALIGTYVMSLQQITLQTMPVMDYIGIGRQGQPVMKSLSGNGALTDGASGNAGLSSPNISEERELDENEFLDFGMME